RRPRSPSTSNAWNLIVVPSRLPSQVSAKASAGKLAGKGRPCSRWSCWGRYSNLADWAKELRQLSAMAGQPRLREQSKLHQVVRRLRADEVNALVARYESGATVYELAALFKIHRTTVSAHLHRHGANVRRGRRSL